MKYTRPLIILSFILVTASFGFIKQNPISKNTAPLEITDVAQYNNFLVFTEKGNKEVSMYNLDGTERLKNWSVVETPTGIITDNKKIYVTVFDQNGGVVILDSNNDQQNFISTGSGACSPILNTQQTKLYVANQFNNTISEIDLGTMKESRVVDVLREPKKIALSEKRNLLFAANFLPAQAANLDTVASAISVIDLNTFTTIKNIPLANGSNALRGLSISPDGDYLFISHNLGRFQVPTNQLLQGWMNTSAMSVINLNTMEFEGSVLLDEPERGAAGIWDINCTDNKIVITHSGVHEISIIDYPAFIDKYKNYKKKDELSYDLQFLGKMRQRIALTGNGPRNFIISDNKAIIPTYFSDTLNIVNLDNPSNIDIRGMVNNRIESDEFKGEKYFNDATYCFQNWQSCNGCHPGDGRTDAMNWDLMNDGIGNPKNCKSMLFSHVTAPCMISGIRPSAEVAVRAGFKFIQFCEIPEEFAVCVDKYLMSLKPVPSPYLVNGKLSPLAEQGRKIYDKMNCVECHSGPYYTDLKNHVIGDDVEFDQGWDTPTLKEVWRTAPYLFDGRAATMKDVFKVHKHGINKKISDKDIDALVEYVNSL